MCVYVSEEKKRQHEWKQKMSTNDLIAKWKVNQSKTILDVVFCTKYIKQMKNQHNLTKKSTRQETNDP